MAMNRSASSGSFSIWKALVVVALVVEVIVVFVLIGGRSVAPESDPGAEVAASSEAGRFADPGVPYSFDYPDGWEIENEEAVTKLLSPGNDIAIAVGPAPAGDVLSSSDQLVEGVSDRYSDAKTDSRELTRVGGNLGLAVTGTAVNEFGIPVRFAIVTIEGTKSANYAITSFAAGVSDQTADRVLQKVVDNFELTTT
jgi:predicted Zn-dependent protease